MINKLLDYFFISRSEFDEKVSNCFPARQKINDLCRLTDKSAPDDILRSLKIFLQGLVRGWETEVTLNDTPLDRERIFSLLEEFSEELGEWSIAYIQSYSKEKTTETNLIKLTEIRIDAYNKKFPNEAGRWEDFQNL